MGVRLGTTNETCIYNTDTRHSAHTVHVTRPKPSANSRTFNLSTLLTITAIHSHSKATTLHAVAFLQ